MIKKISTVVFMAAMVLSPFVVSADTLNRQLEIGMSGSDVSALQTFLAKDSTLYPEGLVTGYFGTLTQSAVARFQARNGIAAVGRVGPISLPVFNRQMEGGVSGVDATPVISQVNIVTNANTASVNWGTNEAARGVVYYSTSPLTTYERVNAVDVSGATAMTDTNLHMSQSVQLPNLQSNTTYYFLVYVTDQSGNVSVTWPSSFRTLL